MDCRVELVQLPDVTAMPVRLVQIMPRTLRVKFTPIRKLIVPDEVVAAP